jgi:hydroxymethylbilane synthase
VEAERAVLATLEAGCSAPVGSLAEVAEGDDGYEIWVRAVALAPDGAVEIRRSASGPLADAAAVGRRLATGMLDEGAAGLIDPPARRQQA